jgi:hypothetical protein
MKEDTQKKEKMEAINCVYIPRANIDLASPDVSDGIKKCKILKDPLADYRSHRNTFELKLST